MTEFANGPPSGAPLETRVSGTPVGRVAMNWSQEHWRCQWHPTTELYEIAGKWPEPASRVALDTYPSELNGRRVHRRRHHPENRCHENCRPRLRAILNHRG